MYTNLCTTGFFCDAGASELADLYLCEEGYYCPDGSSKTKYKQNECLAGFFCPIGTAGVLSSNGSFNEDVH